MKRYKSHQQIISTNTGQKHQSRSLLILPYLFFFLVYWIINNFKMMLFVLSPFPALFRNSSFHLVVSSLWLWATFLDICSIVRNFLSVLTGYNYLLFTHYFIPSAFLKLWLRPKGEVTATNQKEKPWALFPIQLEQFSTGVHFLETPCRPQSTRKEAPIQGQIYLEIL